MKYSAILACSMLGTAALSPVLAQENEAEKLFRDMEKKIRAAKAFQAKATYKVAKKETKLELLITEDNKARLKVTGNFGEDRKRTFELVSDGKRLKSSGAQLSVMPSGLPKIEAGGQSEWPTPQNLHEVMSGVTSRAGMWYSVFVLPYVAEQGFSEKIELDDESSKMRVYDFKLVGNEKVGAQDAKALKYRFGDGTAGADNADITLWIDAKSLLPLKRTFAMKRDKLSVTETYHEYKLDPKIDVKAFELPK